jgi:hypothetical protein
MSVAVATGGTGLNGVADKALKASGMFWFAVAMLGQWAFFYYIMAFSGPRRCRGISRSGTGSPCSAAEPPTSPATQREI